MTGAWGCGWQRLLESPAAPHAAIFHKHAISTHLRDAQQGAAARAPAVHPAAAPCWPPAAPAPRAAGRERPSRGGPRHTALGSRAARRRRPGEQRRQTRLRGTGRGVGGGRGRGAGVGHGGGDRAMVFGVPHRQPEGAALARSSGPHAACVSNVPQCASDCLVPSSAAVRQRAHRTRPRRSAAPWRQGGPPCSAPPPACAGAAALQPLLRSTPQMPCHAHATRSCPRAPSNPQTQ